MSFRRAANSTSRWIQYRERFGELLDPLDRLAAILSTESRFDEFLQSGFDAHGSPSLSIQGLSDEEWQGLSLFVDSYSREWQTYFEKSLYAGYFAEFERRSWTPSLSPLVEHELGEPRLIVQFWARWDLHSRTLDARLAEAVPQFSDRAVFRSLNIDESRWRALCDRSGLANIPWLAHLRNGQVAHSQGGVRPVPQLIKMIAQWID